MEIYSVCQPNTRTTLDAIDMIAQVPDLQSIDVAAAYITSGGLERILATLRSRIGDLTHIQTRWLTSADYCRTEPVALEVLSGLPGASVRLADGQGVVNRRGNPLKPFHPKAFLFRSPQFDYALTGSGNVSRSGLSNGCEAGLAIGIDRLAAGENARAKHAIAELRSWFTHYWSTADALTGPLLDGYRKLYESTENLQNPVPTEDDLATPYSTRGSLTSKDLQKLRACRFFWIEAGGITKNRGPHLPGNQLMMKRLSRVYFGFLPVVLHRNSPIGTVDISYSGQPLVSCSLTFSDNGMDKLVLPVPGAGGPPSYDNKNLLFKRTGAREFHLTIGSSAERTAWKKRSQAVGASFIMSGVGREWGVF